MRYSGRWDNIVLTVGTAAQKSLCLNLLSLMKDRLCCNITVVSDDELGGRTGSGGAVINVLKKYGRDKKLLIINSGGFSKRCINYSVKGKAFANLVYENEAVTLLELIIKKTEKLSEKITSGALICCSDILVDTDFSDLPDCNIGFCNRADLATGTRHGVMYKDKNSFLSYYLHKRSLPELEAMGEKTILADTGTVFFSGEFVNAICNAEEKLHILDKVKNGKIEVNLYPDIISLLSKNIDRERYLYEDAQNEEHVELRKIFYDCFSDYSLKVIEIDGKDFVHFGTLKESVDNINRFTNSRHTAINSYFDGCEIGAGAIIENSLLENCTVGKDSIISDIFLKNADIPSRTAVCGIRLYDGSFVTVCCDTDENPKEKNLWEKKRFYRGKTFTDSYLKFVEQCGLPDVSLADCTENSDYSYPHSWLETLKSLNYRKANEKYIEKRNEILNEYFGPLESVKNISCVKNSVKLELPVRVNFSGTWTDAMPYCTDNGGAVVNMAAEVNGKLPIRVTAEKLGKPVIEFFSDRKTQQINLDEIGNDRYENDFDHFILHRAVLKVLGVNKNTKLTDGFRLSTNVSGLMHGSGLGTSSILLAGCFTALSELFGIELRKNDIVYKTFIAELVMKTGGGWQDQVGGIYPSVKLSQSDAGNIQNVKVKQIDISDSFKAEFNRRIAIVSTGQRHFGRFVVADVMSRYIDGDFQTVNALNNLKELNSDVIKAFEAGNISRLAQCLNNQWTELKKLSAYITDSEIDRIAAECRSIADGVCILGAGAGGYLLLILKESTDEKALKEFSEKPVFKNINEPVKRITVKE